jgi:hypothetical protein
MRVLACGGACALHVLVRRFPALNQNRCRRRRERRTRRQCLYGFRRFLHRRRLRSAIVHVEIFDPLVFFKLYERPVVTATEERDESKHLVDKPHHAGARRLRELARRVFDRTVRALSELAR